MDKRYQSRKFLLACVAFLAGVVFYAIGKMTSPEWISYTQWIVGLYLAANIGDEAVTK